VRENPLPDEPGDAAQEYSRGYEKCMALGRAVLRFPLPGTFLEHSGAFIPHRQGINSLQELLAGMSTGILAAVRW
jgi:hypothetical protein